MNIHQEQDGKHIDYILDINLSVPTPRAGWKDMESILYIDYIYVSIHQEQDGKLLSVPGVSKRLNEAGVKEPIICERVCSLTKQQLDLELLLSRRITKTHTFFAAWGEFTPIVKDVLRLTHLPLLGETNAIGIVLDEDDQLKLKNLIVASIPPD